MKHKKAEIITPSPFFKIEFGCSNRKFYEVKNTLYQIADKLGIEIGDGYISESCDYEGDLEAIKVYNDERSKEFIKAILEHYEIKDEIPEGMTIVLSIF